MLQNKKLIFLLIAAIILGLNTVSLLAEDTVSSTPNMDQYDWRQKLVSDDVEENLGESFLEAFGMNSEAGGETGEGGSGAGSTSTGTAIVIDNSISQITTTTPYSYK
jgi:hypothetical protein